MEVKKVVANFDQERGLALLVNMERIRAFEEQALLAAERDKLVLGAIHPSIGQEAAAVGLMWGLRIDDYLLTTHRGHGHMLISEDEHRILNIIDLLQQNSFTGAGYVLSRWLPPAAVREVMPMFHKLATAMVHRGLKLPGRSHYEVFHRAANHQRRSAHIEPSATIH